MNSKSVTARPKFVPLLFSKCESTKLPASVGLDHCFGLS